MSRDCVPIAKRIYPPVIVGPQGPAGAPTILTPYASITFTQPGSTQQFVPAGSTLTPNWNFSISSPGMNLIGGTTLQVPTAGNYLIRYVLQFNLQNQASVDLTGSLILPSTTVSTRYMANNFNPDSGFYTEYFQLTDIGIWHLNASDTITYSLTNNSTIPVYLQPSSGSLSMTWLSS